VKTDKLFYEVFHELPEVFFELIGETHVNAQDYEFKAIELKETALRLDGVMLRIAKDTKQPIYFIEVQNYKNPNIYSNILRKVYTYLDQNDPTQDWRAVVVYERRSFAPEDEETTPYRGEINSGKLLRIYLDEIDSAGGLSQGISLIKLIVEKEKNAPDRAKALIEQVRSESTDAQQIQKMVNLILTIISYKFTESSLEELQAMLGLEDAKQTRWGQELLAEGRQEGEELGLAKGRQVIRLFGEELGPLEGKLEFAPVLLQLGFTLEEVAQMLKVETEQVRQVAEPETPEQSL